MNCTECGVLCHDHAGIWFHGPQCLDDNWGVTEFYEFLDRDHDVTPPRTPARIAAALSN